MQTSVYTVAPLFVCCSSLPPEPCQRPVGLSEHDALFISFFHFIYLLPQPHHVLADLVARHVVLDRAHPRRVLQRTRKTSQASACSIKLVVQHRQCWAHHPQAPCGSCAGRGITCLLWLHACFHRTNGGHDPISVRHAESRASTCRNTRVAMDMPPAGNVKAHLQRGLRLVQVGVGGRHVDKHERLGGAAQAVAHQHRQLVVAVWYVRLRRRDSQLSAARVTIYAFVLMRRHRQAGTAAASCLVATAPTGVPDSDRRRKALSAQQRAMCLALIQIIIKR